MKHIRLISFLLITLSCSNNHFCSFYKHARCWGQRRETGIQQVIKSHTDTCTHTHLIHTNRLNADRGLKHSKLKKPPSIKSFWDLWGIQSTWLLFLKKCILRFWKRILKDTFGSITIIMYTTDRICKMHWNGGNISTSLKIRPFIRDVGLLFISLSTFSLIFLLLMYCCCFSNSFGFIFVLNLKCSNPGMLSHSNYKSIFEHSRLNKSINITYISI